MPKTLTSLQKQIVRTFFRNSFNRDVVILLIVSIAIGGATGGALAMTANTYFSETITSLVGEYGEFDLLINVREEVKEDGRAQIENVTN